MLDQLSTLLAVSVFPDDVVYSLQKSANPDSSGFAADYAGMTVEKVDDLTVKITDPVMYTQPWYPLNNFRLGMNSPDFDIREMICSVSQQALFNQLLKNTTEASPEKK